MTVCADGIKLPPMMIFKGKQNGRISAKEFSTFSTSCEYFLQENAWIYESAMLAQV